MMFQCLSSKDKHHEYAAYQPWLKFLYWLLLLNPYRFIADLKGAAMEDHIIWMYSIKIRLNERVCYLSCWKKCSYGIFLPFDEGIAGRVLLTILLILVSDMIGLIPSAISMRLESFARPQSDKVCSQRLAFQVCSTRSGSIVRFESP